MTPSRKKPKPTARRKVRTGSSGRILSLLLALTALFLVIGGRLVWLQVAEARAYSKLAEQQRTQEIVLSPRRGAILDRQGQPLAISEDAKTVFAMRQVIKDPNAVAALLAKDLGGDAVTYLKKLTERKRGFVYIERKVPMARVSPLMKELKAAKIEGIGFADDSRRVYPCGDLACQILGFVGVDDRGLAGLELFYNDVLGGKAGRQIAERDALGNPIPGGVQVSEDPVDGKDVMLTIDKDIQYETQVELSATVAKYGAKSGSVIVMNPRDGEIYAMASTPTYDPNDYGHALSDAIRNKAIVDAYEPGSTVKAMTASAVIDQHLFTPDSHFVLPPTITVGGRVIHEAHSRDTVNWSLAEIVTHSSNVGAVKLGKALGPSRLASYFSRFGLLERTGVDFPGEAKGWMPSVDAWSASTIGNVPFGQGVSVTALQLARAVSAIADDGTMVTPHFIRSVRDDSIKMSWPSRSVISSATAHTMTGVLAEVVKDGTGKAAAVNGYQVAGKTGTAQKPIIGGHGYAPGKYVASFIGYLPAQDPRVLILVTIDEPSGAVIYGGSVAAPLFSTLAGYTMQHLGIPPPDRASASATATATAVPPTTTPTSGTPARRPGAAPAPAGKPRRSSSNTARPPAMNGPSVGSAPRNGPATGTGGTGPP